MKNTHSKPASQGGEKSRQDSGHKASGTKSPEPTKNPSQGQGSKSAGSKMNQESQPSKGGKK